MTLPKGTVITCENGHRICELAEDMVSGDIARSDILINYTLGEHIATDGSEADDCVCSRCGAPWAGAGSPGCIVLHTRDGWSY